VRSYDRTNFFLFFVDRRNNYLVLISERAPVGAKSSAVTSSNANKGSLSSKKTALLDEYFM
jgi:hypothetical protein